MTHDEIAKALNEIAERAEYVGHQTGIALRTRSNKEARACHEMADVSRVMLARMIADLATRLAA